MENKAMYLSTYEERESGSMYEDAYDGHNLSKLNLCDEGEFTLSPRKHTSTNRTHPTPETGGTFYRRVSHTHV